MTGEPDRTAAEQLLQRHMTMLKSYLKHLVGSPHDADDLVQDICMTVIREPHILLRGHDAGSYLRGVARHFASRHRRRIRRDPVLESVLEAAWEDPSPIEAAPPPKALKECLAELTDRMRQLLDWRYTQGLNSPQIARKSGLSSDAVRMALLRSRQALAQCLKGKSVPLEGGV